jgi:membrane-associated protease RseP (regulator of RpoE activity)
MVSLLTWALVGIAAFSLAAMSLRARGYLPSAVKVSGPLITVHTKRGRILLNRLSRPTRFWRAYGNVGVGVALVVMVASFLLVVLTGIASLQQPEPSALRQPQNALVIPGVNEFLPLDAAGYIVLALVIGLIVHEGGHGLFCRVGDIDIESMGLVFFTVIPIGAFVEPKEESREEADRGTQTRMFAAGVTNNFVVSIVAFALLFGPVVGSLAVVDGYHVGGTLPDGPAADAGIEGGDVITGIAGRSVSEPADLGAILGNETEREVTVERREGTTVTVRRELIVNRVSAGLDVPTNATLTAVNETAVYTRAGFEAAIRDRPVGTVHWDGGNQTLPLGAALRVRGGPLESAGVPTETSVVVTHAGGERIVDSVALTAWLEDRDPGEQVSLRVHHGGTADTYTVTLGEAGTKLGEVDRFSGTSTIQVVDFGIRGYPAGQFLELLGGDGILPNPLDLPRMMFIALVLPFLGAGAIPGGLGFGFAGFLGIAAEFYVAQGPLAFLGTGLLFLVANVLFWVGWLNLVIGQFNLIPAFPLDGGHILRTSTEAVVARLPVSNRQAATKAVTITVGLTMLAGLVLMFFGPTLLGSG